MPAGIVRSKQTSAIASAMAAAVRTLRSGLRRRFAHTSGRNFTTRHVTAPARIAECSPLAASAADGARGLRHRRDGLDRRPAALAQIRALMDDPMIALLQRGPRPGADMGATANRTGADDLGQDTGDGAAGGESNIGIHSDDGGDGSGETGLSSSFD